MHLDTCIIIVRGSPYNNYYLQCMPSIWKNISVVSRTHTNIYNTMAQVSFSPHMSSGSGDYSTALSNSFLSIDKDLQEEQELQTELGGTTAIVVLVRDNMIYCANAGDSRAVACVAGRVKELSFDHKPYNQGLHFYACFSREGEQKPPEPWRKSIVCIYLVYIYPLYFSKNLYSPH
ncbi:Probable protein phosphatase 2C T23F11.1 [Geodia barretti]|uniref:protein-serine/threonine phosphatase n=1 Tax=Geodia barretti TaxID=519541 RepID=A0AA35S2J6_GEOBA|nr:Probable protein phosphatase 2C T23F11.1 [Geodia barretti]